MTVISHLRLSPARFEVCQHLLHTTNALELSSSTRYPLPTDSTGTCALPTHYGELCPELSCSVQMRWEARPWEQHRYKMTFDQIVDRDSG